MRLKARSKVQLPGHARDRCLCDIAADDAGEVDHDRQKRHHDHQGDNARHREILECIDGRGFERVDLLGHLHRADLRTDTRADASGDEKPGGQRARFTDERNCEAGGNERLGAETLE